MRKENEVSQSGTRKKKLENGTDNISEISTEILKYIIKILLTYLQREDDSTEDFY